MNKEQKVLSLLEQNRDRILQSNYPASIGSQILVNENDYDEKYAYKMFYKWSTKKGILVNMNNF